MIVTLKVDSFYSNSDLETVPEDDFVEENQ
jgi:hypothetical protein